MDLSGHIQSTGTIADVSAYLSNLTPDERWAQLAGLSKRCQRTLYLKAEAAEPLSLADFVPDDVEPHTSVVHSGRNSLPLFRSFEKCFARSESGRVYGYNEGSLRPIIGPGYFVVRETRDDEVGRGAVVVDYHQVPELPDGVGPDGWPPVKPNARGLQYFVFHNTRDYMRRVAPGVTIGSAWKTFAGRERALDSYFVLLRR
jgi:hypothetical protein